MVTRFDGSPLTERDIERLVDCVELGFWFGVLLHWADLTKDNLALGTQVRNWHRQCHTLLEVTGRWDPDFWEFVKKRLYPDEEDEDGQSDETEADHGDQPD